MVSFVIPVFNAGSFIRETIESVLNCGYADTELILADDGSTDDSVAICNHYAELHPGRIKALFHEGRLNKGVSATRRLAISAAKGEYIFFIDADDVLLPGVIHKYLGIFATQPEVVLIHGNVTVVSDGKPHFDLAASFEFSTSDRLYDLSVEKDFLLKNHICNSTVCLRKKILSEVNFHYDQAFQVEDWVLWSLLAEKGKYFYVAEPVIRYRYHPLSATFQVGRKGYVYHTYTLVEYYFVVASRATSTAIRKKASDLLYVHLGMLQKFYNQGKGMKFSAKILTRTFFKDLVKSVIGKN